MGDSFALPKNAASKPLHAPPTVPAAPVAKATVQDTAAPAVVGAVKTPRSERHKKPERREYKRKLRERTHRAPHVWQQIRALFECGFSVAYLATRFEVPRRTIEHHKTTGAWRRQEREVLELLMQGVNAPSPEHFAELIAAGELAELFPGTQEPGREIAIADDTVPAETVPTEALPKEMRQAAVAERVKLGLALIHEHKTMLSRIRGVHGAMLTRLETLMRDGTADVVVTPSVVEGGRETVRIAWLGQRESLHDVLVKLSLTANKLVDLERKVFGLRDSDGVTGKRPLIVNITLPARGVTVDSTAVEVPSDEDEGDEVAAALQALPGNAPPLPF